MPGPLNVPKFYILSKSIFYDKNQRIFLIYGHINLGHHFLVKLFFFQLQFLDIQH